MMEKDDSNAKEWKLMKNEMSGYWNRDAADPGPLPYPL